MSHIEEFFQALDLKWKKGGGDRIVLHIIGSSALMLQSGYMRGTKDSDILETSSITSEIGGELLRLGGKGTPLHRRYRIYIDLVVLAFPFLPTKPNYVDIARLNKTLYNFSIKALDPIDVLVSKISSFRPQDIDDIRAVIDMGIASHDKLIGRFMAAVDRWQMDSRVTDLPRYIDNLHTIERDFFMVNETEIELPRWIEETL